MAMLKKNVPLRCRIIDRVLTIEVGIDTIKCAAERHEDFWQPQTDKVALVVSNPGKFAKDVRDALLHEEEDGSTPLTKMLDDAVLKAVESGSEGLDYDTMESIENAERLAVTEEGSR